MSSTLQIISIRHIDLDYIANNKLGVTMWYFNWILGIGLALAFGIINVMWLEANYAFGERDEATTQERFELSRQDEERQ
jgi:cyd operon protein YbgT